MATPTGKKKKSAEATAQTAEATPVAAPTVTTAPKRLTRSSTDKVIFGVCGGIGEYLNIDSTLIRLLFIILAISGGSGILVYIVLGIILPDEMNANKSTKEVIEENSRNFEKTVEDAASRVEAVAKQRNTQTWIGFGVIILGVLLLSNNFGYLAFADVMRVVFKTLWPLAIIAAGLLILTRSKNGK